MGLPKIPHINFIVGKPLAQLCYPYDFLQEALCHTQYIEFTMLWLAKLQHAPQRFKLGDIRLAASALSHSLGGNYNQSIRLRVRYASVSSARTGLSLLALSLRSFKRFATAE